MKWDKLTQILFWKIFHELSEIKMKIKTQKKHCIFFFEERESHLAYVFYLKTSSLRQNTVVILRDAVSVKRGLMVVDLCSSVALLSI